MLLTGRCGDFPEGIQPGSVLHDPLAVQDIFARTFQSPIKTEGVIVCNPLIIPFDGRQVVKTWSVREVSADCFYWETLVVNDESLLDVIVHDKASVRRSINAVAREHLGTDRFHPLDVIGIKDGDISGSLHSSFV